MRTKMMAWLSTLLMVAGLLLPSAAAATGGDPLVAAAKLLASVGSAAEEEGPSLVATTFSATASAASSFVSADNLAPGDEMPSASEYLFTYVGTDPANVSITTSLSGALTTCNGGDKFIVTLTDPDTGQEYSPNQADQPVRVMTTGETLSFVASVRLDLSAGNDCQGKQAFFSIQPTAVVIPPTPQVLPTVSVTGSITVRVMDNSPDADGPTPIANAEVQLSSGQSGLTNASGEITFANLPEGSYQVTVRSVDPRNPIDSSLQVAVSEVEVTAAEPDAQVNVVFEWELPAAAPPPPIERTAGTVTVIVLDGSSRHGANSVPVAGAQVILGSIRTGVTDADGKLILRDIPYGTYEVIARSRDPANPILPTTTAVETVVTVDEDVPDARVTLILAWEPPAAPASPPSPPTGTPSPPDTAPPLPAPVPPAGQIRGRICSPLDPGAELVAAGPEGQSAGTFVAYDGDLGKWRAYALTGLAPGVWQLTLNSPDGTTVSQNLTVPPGGTATAADFTLACTGDGTPLAGSLPWWPYLTGGLLLTAGVLIRTRYHSKGQPL